MNNTNLSTYSSAGLDALQARFALRVAARLTEGAADLPAGVNERLRFAREQALERARAARRVHQPAEAVVSVSNGPTLALGGGKSGWWVQLAGLVPLVALVGGLVLIQQWHSAKQVSAAAEIDASLLADDVPPSAYADPGFVEFLKAPRD
jgi:hypothetical protein